VAAPAWIDLLDPDDDALASALPADIHSTAMARLGPRPDHEDEPRPRLESHGTYLFGVIAIPYLVDGEVVSSEIDVIVTLERLITLRRTTPGCDPFPVDELRKAALTAGDGAGMCLYRVVDEVAEHYLSIIDGFDDDIDKLEDMVETMDPGKLREEISRLRHAILQVRRIVVPSRDLARAVIDGRIDIDEDSLFPRDVELHFADSYDKLLRATDGLYLSRDLLAGVRDYHQAQGGERSERGDETPHRDRGGAVVADLHRRSVRRQRERGAGVPLGSRLPVGVDPHHRDDRPAALD
jgi:Mg2+ and Co2+ transporter CorA